MVVALVALFVALGGTTWAATGDKFILGKSNTADQTSSLSSTAANPALKVENTSTGIGLIATSSANYGIQGTTSAANRAGVAAYHFGTSSGYGLYASSGPGYAVFGSGGTAGGSFVGQGTGDGVQGKATADHKSGVWAHHDGGSFGYGLFAQSSTGPAIGLQGNTNSAPITLDGNPFPAAVAGFKDGFVDLPDDGTPTAVATLGGIAAGTYVVIATTSVGLDFGNRVDCTLAAGADNDSKHSSGDIGHVEMTFVVFHRFASAGSVTLTCSTTDSNSALEDTKIVAIQVAGGTNTPMP
jgi:hypothetical protein